MLEFVVAVLLVAKACIAVFLGFMLAVIAIAVLMYALSFLAFMAEEYAWPALKRGTAWTGNKISGAWGWTAEQVGSGWKWTKGLFIRGPTEDEQEGGTAPGMAA